MSVAAASRAGEAAAGHDAARSDALIVFVTGLYEPTARDSVAIHIRDYVVGLHDVGARVAVLDMTSQGAFSSLFNIARTVAMLGAAYGRERLGVTVARQLLRWRRLLVPAVRGVRFVRARVRRQAAAPGPPAARPGNDDRDRMIVKSHLLKAGQSPLPARSVVCVITGYDLLFATEWASILKEAVALRLGEFCPDAADVRWVVNVINESTRVAPALCRGVEFFDEVWVPADFQVRALAASGAACRSVSKIASAVDLTLFHPDVTPLRLRGRRGFCFLTLSQYLPDFVKPSDRRQDLHDLGRLWNHARKATDLLIRAFVAEFGADEDVCLAIKTTHDSNRLRTAVEAIVRETGCPSERMSQFVLLGGWTSARELPQVYAAADAFVLVSRCEGWGRPLAEAMAMGIPAIATNFGGNTEFMNAGNSYLVGCDIVPVASSIGAKFRSLGEWAEPSFHDLRRTLREVFEDADGARAKGRRAAQHIGDSLSRETVARAIRGRVDTLFQA